MSIMSKLTVVIPAYNSKKTISQCLRAINKSNFLDFETVVIDDASTDNTVSLAKPLATWILVNTKNLGKTQSRLRGFKASKSTYIVNIDSDVVIYKNTINKINKYFDENPEIDAITGKLSKTNPYANFCSQYKTLYMNYYFDKLPKHVTFIYGSIFAVRKTVLDELSYKYGSNYAEDTDLGQQICRLNKNILLPKKLYVKHYKYYSLISLLKNDITIPYYWAILFFKYKGWTQLGQKKTGFAHASKEQLLSLILAPLTLMFFLFSTLLTLSIFISTILFVSWLGINLDFFHFLYKGEKITFTIKSIVFTYLDHLVMSLGVLMGTLSYIFSYYKFQK